MADPIVVTPYDPEGPALFAELGEILRRALGPVALRIDHIGSTAVPGLAAKPVIDVQISVSALEPLAAYAGPLQDLGFVHRADNPDRTKRYFREAPGARRVHIHVRQAGSAAERSALLFRDFLRADGDEASAYARSKSALAEEHRDDRSAYVEAKAPFVRDAVQRAERWALNEGWQPADSDA